MKAMKIKNKTLSIEEYLDDIKPCLSNLTDDHKTRGECKIKLIMAINCFSSNNSEETRTIHSNSDNIEIMMSSGTYEIHEELFLH